MINLLCLSGLITHWASGASGLPGAVSPDVLHNASLRVTLTVSGSGRY